MKMEIFLIWIIGSIIVAIIASKARKRNGFGWFLLSLLFSPLLMVVLVLALPKDPNQKRRQCPYCHSKMPMEASVCATCTRESPPITQAQLDAYKRQVKVPAF
jgi:hypothetical protein